MADPPDIKRRYNEIWEDLDNNRMLRAASRLIDFADDFEVVEISFGHSRIEAVTICSNMKDIHQEYTQNRIPLEEYLRLKNIVLTRLMVLVEALRDGWLEEVPQ